MTDYQKIEAAFAELREEGFFAEQDFGCCYGGGFDRLARDAHSSFPAGVVFSTSPAHDFAFFGMGWLKAPGSSLNELIEDLYLAWDTPGGDPSRIIEALVCQGLVVEPPENAAMAIRIASEKRSPQDTIEVVLTPLKEASE